MSRKYLSAHGSAAGGVSVTCHVPPGARNVTAPAPPAPAAPPPVAAAAARGGGGDAGGSDGRPPQQPPLPPHVQLLPERDCWTLGSLRARLPPAHVTALTSLCAEAPQFCGRP